MALEDDIALLSRVPMIGTIDKDALRLIAFSAETKVLKAGDVLFRKDEPADGGYVLVKGAIAMMSEDGTTARSIIGPGGLIGELALISETKRPATAIAREATLVLRIPRTLFRRTLEEYPHVAERLAKEIRERVTATAAALSGVKRRFDQIG